MKVDFHDISKLMQDAVTEILWEYHQHRLETQEWYKEIDDQLGDGVTMGRDFMMMNMTEYLYDKYELVVTEHKGYRVEITYSEDGVERTRKTVPEIQGLTISAKDLSDNEVIQKVLQIAARISDERTVDK
jgi:hypothetical protein